MPETPFTLPPRPSLEQLRKQAKERRDASPGATLADAQFALARDYGFDSWPKLVRHVEALARPEIEQQERIARDLVAAYHQRDEAAAARLNDLFHSAITIDQIRHFIERRLSPLPDGEARRARFDAADARQLVARLYGFGDWDGLVDASAGLPAPDGAPGLSAAPPFFAVDADRGIVSVRQPMSPRDWDMLIAAMQERGLTGLEANNMMDDAALQRLTAVGNLAVLKIHGSDRVTDSGLRHLAAFGALEEVELGGWKSTMTDAGFAALRGLPRLRAVRCWWSRHLSDAGVRATLAPCAALEDANFGGTSIGDGLIAALAGKPGVHRLFAGDAVSDAGLAQLHEIPRFRQWHGGERKYGLMEFDAGPTYLAIKGPFTAAGLRSLGGLAGLFAINVHWLPGGATSADLGVLASLPYLGFLAIDGDLCDDEAMRQIGRLPRLRMLLAQEPAAGDEGFAGLSASRTIEYIWGRECPNLTGRGFRALSAMPALQGLAVSCKQVDDSSLAVLPRFPALRALMPMDVPDDGFRHIGQCRALRELWCMYCRDTTDAATEHVAALPLTTYYAGLTQITDRSLATLARMRTLERVTLHHCQRITDAGVRSLSVLPRLRELSVEGSPNVTRSGLSAFRPTVRVGYSTL